MTREIVETYPLAPMQEGMLFNSLLAPGAGVEIQQIACDLQEEVRPAELRRAWETVVARHALLRTSFSWDGTPLQHVHRSVDVPWKTEDVSPAGPERERGMVGEFLERDRDAGMDLAAPPLMRLALLRMGPGHACLVWTFHHALLDGRSFPIILDEVFTVYDALVAGREAQLPPVLPFRDFVAWLAGRDLSPSRRFWKEMLSGFTGPTPVPCETGGPGPAGGKTKHSEGEIVFPAGSSASLRALAQANGISLNTLIQGCWAILLSRYTREEDVVFGTIRAGRHSTVPGAESMTGNFINLLPVRARVERGTRLLPFLKGLRAEQTLVRPHEHLPLAEVQALSPIPRGTPLFHSILVFDTLSLNARLRSKGGPWLRRSFTIRSQTGYPLTLAMYGDEQFTLKIEFDRGRFAVQTIERMLAHARTMMEGMAKDPECLIGELPWLGESERSALLAMSGPRRVPVPEASLHALFEEQARRNPSATALAEEGTTMTYAELNGRANGLAHRLIALGVVPGATVGICLGRSAGAITAIFGVLKAGGVYVPLDPAYPPDHIAFMIGDAGIRFVVTGEGSPATFPAGVTRIRVDDPDGPTAPRGDPGLEAGNRAPAYIIYTSGTTGRPKGVLVEHRSVVNYVMALGRRLRITPEDRLLQFASMSFDTSAEEIYGALFHGASLVLRSEGMIDTFGGFLAKCAAEHVTVLDLPTAYWHGLVGAVAAEGLSLPPEVRTVLIGGEQASARHLAEWRRLVSPAVQLVNGYGPTESTIVATLYDVPPGAPEEGGQGGVPIGRPVDNCSAYVLGPDGGLLPAGVPGELHIGGEGLARGYVGSPGMTSERFIPDPFSAGDGTRLYRTGDLARWLPEGVLEFLGRTDQQVKIRGFRVEPGEIETLLREHPGVRDAAVIPREEIPGELRLVAYCALRGGARFDPGGFREYLKGKLPSHMIPSVFVPLDIFPTTVAGKVDRRAFPSPQGEAPRPAGRADVQMTPTEEKLADMFGRILGRAPVGPGDNFFELGGHSLLAMQLISRIHHAWEVNVGLVDIFDVPTIRGLAMRIEERLVEEIENLSEEDVARLRQ